MHVQKFTVWHSRSRSVHIMTAAIPRHCISTAAIPRHCISTAAIPRHCISTAAIPRHCIEQTTMVITISLHKKNGLLKLKTFDITMSTQVFYLK